ncbi:anchored repeat-type ABC transporter permease subunit [Corynebacterium choanae]|uniref:Manganese transport system membrane protein MntB n=1 Tax=Corynebacterium choanae TaxID=1862358 RepID=A0A3G6J5X5_9CORY|nr:anchored repeat-type ABC transporter permease subunit [Corynebacterium choanae]AZA13346.1 Manganese transport system membrane protein MntB [Corynebacterium choanae]
MVSLLDFFADITNPSLPFLPRAIMVAMLAAVVCGIVGVHVVLRGMAFIGDCVSHAVFPGIALAFLFGGSLLLGGAIAGIAVAVLVAMFAAKQQIKEDSLIGMLMAAAFAVGVVIVSRVNGYTAQLSTFLFGSITGVSTVDVLVVAATAVAVIVVCVVMHHWFVVVAVDRESARSLGVPVAFVDVVLYVVVAIAVVVSVQTVGNILVLALLITPAATARLVSNSVAAMLVIAPVIGAVGSFFGVYFAWSIDVPTGAAIVLSLTAVFFLVWLVGPRGLIGRRLVRFQPWRRRQQSAAA